MKARRILRIISLVMLVVAIVFIFVCLSVPTLGSTFYIGSFKVTVKILHIFYRAYAIIMVGTFVASFFFKKGNAE